MVEEGALGGHQLVTELAEVFVLVACCVVDLFWRGTFRKPVELRYTALLLQISQTLQLSSCWNEGRGRGSNSSVIHRGAWVLFFEVQVVKKGGSSKFLAGTVRCQEVNE